MAPRTIPDLGLHLKILNTNKDPYILQLKDAFWEQAHTATSAQSNNGAQTAHRDTFQNFTMGVTLREQERIASGQANPFTELCKHHKHQGGSSSGYNSQHGSPTSGDSNSETLSSPSSSRTAPRFFILSLSLSLAHSLSLLCIVHKDLSLMYNIYIYIYICMYVYVYIYNISFDIYTIYILICTCVVIL